MFQPLQVLYAFLKVVPLPPFRSVCFQRQLTPSSKGVEKYEAEVTSDGTNAHSTIPLSPLNAFKSLKR